MTPELKALLDEIICKEYGMAMCEQNLMSLAQSASYNGFKRFHRYNSREHFEHATRLSNFMVYSFNVTPEIMVNYINMSYPNIESSFITQYEASEKYTHMLFSAISKAMEDKQFTVFEFINKIVDKEYDIMDEYKRFNDMNNNTKGDKSYLQLLDKDLHWKYKCKEKKRQGRNIK